ncbi:MAG: restriction endonuclease subunit R, partial [Chloroflexi bacterium]|nr:restriction endonuclease subunit R [Chloroflexota bacterium]
TFAAAQVDTLEFSNLRDYVSSRRYAVDRSLLDDGGWSLARREVQELLRKLSDTGVPLLEYVDKGIHFGIKTGLNEAFVIDEATRDNLIAEHTGSAQVIKPFLAGRDIKRYADALVSRWVICIPSGWTNANMGSSKDPWRFIQESFPAVINYLKPYKAKAEKRWDKGDFWWELRPCAYYGEFEQPKIMLPDISLRGNFILDESGEYYCVNTAYIIGNADKYLLGILNSKLITFVYSHISSTYRGGYLRFIYQYLAKLPIRTIDFDNSADAALHDEMVALVETMLELHKQLPSLSGEARRVVELRIEATDREIDALVYTLYGLGEDEVGIVEGG